MTQAGQYSHPQRLHPLTMLYRGIVSLPGVLLALFTAVNRGEQMFTFLFLLLVVVFTLPGILLGYYYFRFHITSRDVVIEKGVLSRTTRNIPVERIQNITVQQNFFQRLLGIARVHIETAGGQETEGVLEFVSTREAESIRAIIRSIQNERTEPDTRQTPQPEGEQAEPATTPGSTVFRPDAEETEAESLLFSMSLKDVLLCGMFGFSFVFVAVIFTALQYIGIAPENLVKTLANEQINFLQTLDTTALWLFGTAVLLLAILLSWITGILLTMNRYYNFRLTLDGGKLHTQSGLLATAKTTMPLKKLQMLIIASNPLSRRFGFRALELQTAGFGTKQKRPEVAVPLAKEERVIQLAQKIRSFVYPESFHPVSTLTIRRAMIRYSITFLILVGAGSVWSVKVTWLLLLLPLLYYLAVLRYRYRGYVLQPDVAIIQHGFWRRRVAVIPIAKIQTIVISETFFQRRLHLATLHVDTAGSTSWGDASIVDMNREDAYTIMEELMASFRTVRSGQQTPATQRQPDSPAADEQLST